LPKPEKTTSLPRLSALSIVSSIASTASPASFLLSPDRSATWSTNSDFVSYSSFYKVGETPKLTRLADSEPLPRRRQDAFLPRDTGQLTGPNDQFPQFALIRRAREALGVGSKRPRAGVVGPRRRDLRRPPWRTHPRRRPEYRPWISPGWHGW
jgi:hypothetical protein